MPCAMQPPPTCQLDPRDADIPYGPGKTHTVDDSPIGISTIYAQCYDGSIVGQVISIRWEGFGMEHVTVSGSGGVLLASPKGKPIKHFHLSELSGHRNNCSNLEAGGYWHQRRR